MDLKAIKELAQKFSVTELKVFADELENTGECKTWAKDDPSEALSDLLQAAEVRNMMDNTGITLQEAVREFSKRVRGIMQ